MGRGPVPGDAFYRQLIDGLNDGVYFVDAERRISYWSRAAEQITGYEKEEVLGRLCHDNLLRHVDGEGRPLCNDGCPLAATCLDGKAREAEVFLHHKAGHRVRVVVKSTPIRDSRGTIVGASEVFSEGTDQDDAIRRVKELERIAFLDPLTGAGNRRFCEHVLHQRFAEFRRYDTPFGLLFLDIDRFKGINDAYGHRVGDAALKTVANTLTHSVRTSDFLGRWGGEEFIVVAVQSDIEELAFAAERLRMAVAASEVQGPLGSFGVTVSIGATMACPEEDVTSLVERADALMYRSKVSGRNRVTLENARAESGGGRYPKAIGASSGAEFFHVA